MTVGEAAELLERARRAQKPWAAVNVRERVRVLRRLRREIALWMDEIVEIISAEVGKPAMDALSGDVLVTVEQLKMYERMAPTVLQSSRLVKPPFLFSGARFTEYCNPYGVVVVFAPWNYPLQLALVPAATALYAGNAVVLKCSEHTPRTAELIDGICRRAGLPENLIQVSCAAPVDAAAFIDARPDFIFFTGSTHGGRAVMAKAAEQLIPLVLELGGKDPALVFESCDLERTVAGVSYASFANAGQVCVSAKRVYVQEGIYERFLTLFLDHVGRLRCGTSTDAEYGPLRVPGVQDRLRTQVQDAIAKGARVHTGLDAGAPVVLSGVPHDAELLQQESFGPVVCVESFKTEDDAIRLANDSNFALSATVWTGDAAQGERVAAELCCGTCAVNDAMRHVGNPYASFGGNKDSGFGRYRGPEGLLAFSRKKTVMTVAGRRRKEIHWFPFSATRFHQLAALLRLRHSRGLRRFSLRGVISLLPLAVACVLSAAQTSAGELKVHVEVPEGVRGRLAYLLFASSAGFPDHRNQALRRGFVDIVPGQSVPSIDIGGVPPGRYAVSVFLDENGNGKLDKNWLGIPKEPAGASKNPRPHAGAPRFEECAFTHGPDAQAIDITLQECCKR